VTGAALPIRLLALDLDGTLMGGDGVIPSRTREAIAEALARGVVVTIATGRMYASALPYALNLGLSAPLICYQGAYVRELPTPGGEAGALLYHRPMDAGVARQAISWSRARGFDPHVNLDDRLIVEVDDASIDDYERRSGVVAYFVPDLLRAIDAPPTKVLAVGAAPLPERWLGAARQAFHGRAHVTVSHRDYLEWNAPGVTKGRAVAWLAERLGIPLRQTMTVGDQHNDAEMLAAAGHGVAMGGAPDAVRAAARYSTGTVEADGAAAAIEALVLGRGSLP